MVNKQDITQISISIAQAYDTLTRLTAERNYLTIILSGIGVIIGLFGAYFGATEMIKTFFLMILAISFIAAVIGAIKTAIVNSQIAITLKDIWQMEIKRINMCKEYMTDPYKDFEKNS